MQIFLHQVTQTQNLRKLSQVKLSLEYYKRSYSHVHSKKTSFKAKIWFVYTMDSQQISCVIHTFF